MAYIQHQAQTSNGADQQAEVMSTAYEVQLADGTKHHVVSLPMDSSRNETTGSMSHGNQQQTVNVVATTAHENDEVSVAESNNHRASSASGTEDCPEKEQSMSGQTSAGLDGSASVAGVGKTPNSYKFPLLKRYFEFGPWIGRNRKAICLACQIQTSSSQPDRLLKHLNRCSSLTEADKTVVKELMNDRTANKRRKPMSIKLKRGDTDQDSEYYGEDEGNASLADDLSLGTINTSHTTIPQSAKRARREHTDRKSQIDEALAKFIMMCRIPLKAIHSKEFVELVRLLDPEYHIPSRETITNVLIPGLLNII